jgi:signal transduction histidine kinase
MLTEYSKRFAASAIGFARRYRSDPFFHTEVNIIGLQILFALGIVVLIAASFNLLDKDLDKVIVQGMNAGRNAGSSAVLPPDILAQMQSVRMQHFSLIVGVILITTLVFAYLIARITLAPTRNALSSQKQFIGNVAHELRTPLAIIKTNTEVALMGKDVSAELRKTLEGTVEELDRTSEIINNLLSLSASIRPERMEFKDVNLGEVVYRVLEHLRGLSDPKHLEIEARISEQRTVLGNAVALEQIVMNVIKNAITHTPRDGRILVAVEPVYPNHMEFTVQDSGSGIARKDLFRIFEPYYRGDPSRKRGGSGLGLTIVSELVKLHNGKITVRSAEARGTTITVLLPVGRQAPGIDGVVKRDPEHASEVAVDFSQSRQRNS